MEYGFTYLGKSHKVKVESTGDSKVVSVDGKKEIKVDAMNLGANILSLVVDGKVFTAYVAQDKEKYYVFVEGEAFTFDKGVAESSVSRDVSARGTGNTVVSSMPGSLVKLLASSGKQVKAGETVAIVEAMKMENELKSPIDGTVKQVNYKEGDQVDAFKPIVELET